MGERRASERGSVLMLVPAGVLVLFVLGALAVDVAIAFQAQRELSATAAALANDAATVALLDDRFYAENAAGVVEVDERQAADVVREALAARAPSGVSDVRWSVRSADDQVCVSLTARVDYLFSRAVPGAPQAAKVSGRAVATAVRGDRPARRSGVDC